jgi:hypothetical protein
VNAQAHGARFLQNSEQYYADQIGQPPDEERRPGQMVGAPMRQAAPHNEGWDKAALRDSVLRLARIFVLATLALWATRTYGAEHSALHDHFESPMTVMAGPLSRPSIGLQALTVPAQCASRMVPSLETMDGRPDGSAMTKYGSD